MQVKCCHPTIFLFPHLWWFFFSFIIDNKQQSWNPRSNFITTLSSAVTFPCCTCTVRVKMHNKEGKGILRSRDSVSADSQGHIIHPLPHKDKDAAMSDNWQYDWVLTKGKICNTCEFSGRNVKNMSDAFGAVRGEKKTSGCPELSPWIYKERCFSSPSATDMTTFVL